MATRNATSSNESSTRPQADQQSSSARADQERSIQTEKERGGQTGLTRRAQRSTVYGPGPDSPYQLMRRMADDMDRLFENFGFGALGLAPNAGSRLSRDLWNDRWSGISQSMWSPQVETFRRGDKLVVRADLPGLTKDDIKVEIDDGILSISGERSEEHEDERDDFYRSERSYGQFYRAVQLPEGVTGDQCDASFKDGVLEVSLNAPKQSERRAKQVPIR